MVIVTSLLFHNCSDLYGAFCLPNFALYGVKSHFPAVFGKGQIMNYSAIETGKRIQKLRKEMGLTQEQLAKMLSISDRHIRNFETGERNASIEFLVAISNLFDVSLDYIILGKSAHKQVKEDLQIMLKNIGALVEKL